MIIKQLFYLFILLLFPFFAYTADEDTGFWATGSVNKSLSNEWQGGVAIQARMLNGFDQMERVVFRPSMTYLYSTNLSLAFGYDAHFIKTGSNSTEQRLWQQLAVSGETNLFRSIFRFRLEERFLDGIDGTVYRSRFLLGSIWPTGSELIKNIVIRNEVFFNLNQHGQGPRSGFDQNRLFAGVITPITDGLTGELGYQNQYINRSGREDFTVHQLFIAITINFD